MRLFEWFRKRPAGDTRIGRWHDEWRAAVEATGDRHVGELGRALDALGLAEEEIEVEREMLDGLADLVALEEHIARSGLPVVETGHRVVGADACHLIAPASMPDDTAQPAGRLFLTSARVIFAGGGASTAVPWHAVAEVLQQERDLVITRADQQRVYRFRCNAYGDALRAAATARRLATSRRRSARGL